MSKPYAEAASTYYDLGWSPLPVVGKGGNLPRDYTGRDGVSVSAGRMDEWIADRGEDNVCLRVPHGVVGIDVDGYDAKQGPATLKKAIAKWGGLPATYVSSSRRPSDVRSGIYWFTVPVGIEFPGVLKIDGTSDIEFIQRHHRYAVAWPSIHPDTGNQYRWYSPEREQMDTPPAPDDFPALPQAWVEALGREAVKVAKHEPVPVAEVRADPQQWDRAVAEAFHELVAIADAPAGSRHDSMLAVVAELCRQERRGMAGATTALEMGANTWESLMGDERGGYGLAAKEYADALAGGRKLVATTPTTAVDEASLAWLQEWEPPTTQSEEAVATESDEGLELPAPSPSPGGWITEALLDDEAITNVPEPEPLVPGWLFRRSFAALSAPPKTGKTFIALDLALALATGTRWVGGNIPRQGRVLYIIGEGVSGVGQRVRAWKQEHPNASANGWIDFVPTAVQLKEREQAHLLLELAAARDYDLIVIDTLARASVGAEENSAKEMGQIIAVLDKLKEVSGACVLVVHHTGKDASRGLRGSSAIGGALDTSIVCEGDTANLWIKTDFQKDIDGSAAFQVTFKKVGTSIVPVPASAGLERSDGEQRALEVLMWGGAAISRSEWQRQCIARGMSDTDAYDSIGALILSGMATPVGQGYRPLHDTRPVPPEAL